jgi:hypothetical protein
MSRKIKEWIKQNNAEYYFLQKRLQVQIFPVFAVDQRKTFFVEILAVSGGKIFGTFYLGAYFDAFIFDFFNSNDFNIGISMGQTICNIFITDSDFGILFLQIISDKA